MGAPFSHPLELGLLPGSANEYRALGQPAHCFCLNCQWITENNVHEQPRITRHFLEACSVREKTQDK